MDTLSEWFTAQELAGKEDMPSTARRAKDKLEALSENFPEKRRQRQGSKATEYHISILPPLTIRDLKGTKRTGGPLPFIVTGAALCSSIPATIQKNSPKHKISNLLKEAISELDSLNLETKVVKVPEIDNVELNGFEIDLIRMTRQSSEEGQEAIINMARTMAAMQQKKEETEGDYIETEPQVA